jgi:hypothetical protein
MTPRIPGDTTAWLRMQSEAKRSRPAGSPCNLRFAGRFSEIAGRAIHCLPNFPMVSRRCKGFSLFEEQGAFYGFAGKSSEEWRMVAGLVSQITLRHSRAAYSVRCAAAEFRDLPVSETGYRLAGGF